MWKYLVSLVVLLALGGMSAAQIPVCDNCYANVITQDDYQSVDTVRIGLGDDWVAVGNEGLSAAVIVTPELDDGDPFKSVGFARIDQSMDQEISNLGPQDINISEGAKGITWNKAIQAAWIANEGIKENETVNATTTWVKEGAYIGQNTEQYINNVYDYDSREHAKILNVDNKLAMIVDNLTTIIDITAKANSEAHDNQSSTGTISNYVDLTITAVDD